MNGIKILHIADIHIGRKYNALAPNMGALRSSEVLSTLEATFKRFGDADIALLAGDIFEPDASEESIDFVCCLLARYPHMRIFVACGNHDCYESAAIDCFMQKAPDNVTVFSDMHESVVLDDLKTIVYGISFVAPCSYVSLLTEFRADATDYTKIMVMHADVATTSVYNPINREEISGSGLDYLALGHVHSFSGILNSGKVTYAYPGVPEPGGFDETGKCGVIYGTVAPGSCDLDFYPISGRRYEILELDITGYTSQQQVISELNSKLLPDNLYRIVLKGSPDFGAPDTELYTNAVDAFYVEFKDECKSAESILDYRAEKTLKGKTADILESKRALCTEEVFDKACDILTNLMCRG